MNDADESEFKGASGIHIVGTILSRARQEFWSTSPPERGIDAFAGVCQNSRRTGHFIGVQVKCGDSYFDRCGFPVFRASPANYNYWTTAQIPILGVVVCEDRQNAHWFYLSDPELFDQVKTITTVTLPHGKDHRIDASNAESVLFSIIQEYYGTRVPLPSTTDTNGHLGMALFGDDIEGEQENTMSETWTMLLDQFTGKTTGRVQRTNAGHRLSWYFPSVPEGQKEEAFARMKELPDEALTSILDCIGHLIEQDSPWVAELLIDMLIYTPEARRRIQELEVDEKLTPRARRWTYQVHDYLYSYSG